MFSVLLPLIFCFTSTRCGTTSEPQLMYFLNHTSFLCVSFFFVVKHFFARLDTSHLFLLRQSCKERVIPSQSKICGGLTRVSEEETAPIRDLTYCPPTFVFQWLSTVDGPTERTQTHHHTRTNSHNSRKNINNSNKRKSPRKAAVRLHYYSC